MLLDELLVGMILAQPIMINASLVQDKGEALKKETIERLKDSCRVQVEFQEDLVNDKSTPPIAQDDVNLTGFSLNGRNIQDYSYDEKKLVVEKYLSAVLNIKNVFQMAVTSEQIELASLLELVEDIKFYLLDNYAIINAVKNLRGSDDYTFQHSVNVAILSGIIGTWLKISDSDINTLILAGLMHDIGRMKIPLNILKKPQDLTKEEFDIMRQHPVYSYQILMDILELPKQVPLVALQHHERNDGSGYPYNLTGEKIDNFSKIVAVADTYDSLTTDHLYKQRSIPLKIMKIFDDEMFSKMDARCCLTILSQIRDSLLNKHVVLKDGSEAVIVFIGKPGVDELIVRMKNGKFLNIGKTNYQREIVKYIG